MFTVRPQRRDKRDTNKIRAAPAAAAAAAAVLTRVESKLSLKGGDSTAGSPNSACSQVKRFYLNMQMCI